MSETFNEYYTRVSSRARRKSLEEELGIVRCKDCKYWDTYDGRSWCERVVGGCGEMTANDFCSRGEQRGEEDD